MRDGTICFAAEMRKPYTRKGAKGEYIDRDGCHGDWRLRVPIPAELSEANRTIYMTSITNKLNTKKLLREMVGQRLDRIEQQLSAIQALLDSRSVEAADTAPGGFERKRALRKANVRVSGGSRAKKRVEGAGFERPTF